MSWDAFESFRLGNPQAYAAFIAEQEQEREWADDSREPEENQNETIPIADTPGIFPMSLQNTTELKMLHSQYSSYNCPPIILRGDIDSVYTYSESLESIVSACGTKNWWKMPSITRQHTADTASRFCINSELCEKQPVIRSGVAQTAPLNWFPNVKVAICSIKEWGCDVHVQLYFLGVDRLTSNQHFTHLQLGVVNTMFNLARAALMLNHHQLDPSTISSLRRFENLHTKVGSREWNRDLVGQTNELSPTAMGDLSRSAVAILEHIADNDQSLRFEHPFWNGIQPEDKRTSSLDRQAMVRFAKKLKNSMVFTASLAGCKGRFAGQEFMTKIDINNLVSVNDNDSDGDSSSDSSSDSESNSDSDSSTEIEEAWVLLLNQKIKKERDELNQKVMSSFRSAFATMRPREGENVTAEWEEVADEESRWYVDIGCEVSLDAEVNIFPRLSSSERILRKQLRER